MPDARVRYHQQFVNAEQAYMFRHALVREAAYQLQLPGDRARLHELAADALEAIHGAPAECGVDLESFTPTAADPFAEEICTHLEAALTFKGKRARKEALLARAALHLRRAAHHSVEQFRYMEAAERFERLATEFGALIPDAPLELLKAADAASRAFQPSRTRALCRRALRLARRNGNLRTACRALIALGRHFHHSGRGRRAAKVLDLALAMLRELRDNEGLMVATAARGALALDRDDFERAQTLLNEALQLARSQSHVRREGTALNNFAALHIEMSNPEKALEILETALDFNRRHANLRALAFTWTNIGSIHNSANRNAEAEAALGEALAIHQQIANYQHAGYALNLLGRICERTGRPLEARRNWLAAADCFAACGNAKFEGGTRCDAAIVLAQQGDPAQAKAEFARGIELVRQDPDRGLVERMTAKFEQARARA